MKTFFTHLFFLIALSVAAGAARSLFPHAISWSGRWPTSSTSAEEAYQMMAQQGDPPFVSFQDVITLHEKKQAVFIDARSKEEFVLGHIPQARHVPYYSDEENGREKAIEGIGLDSPLVVYCEGVGCELSFFLGRELQGIGYSNIRIFYGGYPEWKEAGLPVGKSGEVQ